ncbi:unnamed protein product [Ilex paraguariensis]|uniref:Uncharacterized protein n=1 Tax=Ilex paraguariensis TaxID=185542 RepID=A0ABC8QT84_9AQUA
MQRLRTSGSSFIRYQTVPQMRRKALDSWSAVQDTYYSTKDIFESHKVVFTISTSIASVATAWFGYSLRHFHESRVDQRLESIEKAMKNTSQLEHTDIQKLVGSGSISIPACAATAGTSFILGYGLGWRGGKWSANGRFRKEQMKLLGQLKPKRWHLKFLQRPLIRPRLPGILKRKLPENTVGTSEALQKDVSIRHNSGDTQPAC